ncbi:MAG: PleD family two-component system response regulator [Rhodospirillales bacterium]|nr:PleD family two-component system response regulator [Rhodospirillales bacterium]
MSARVLVVDDIELNARYLEILLCRDYYDVVHATSGPGALEILSDTSIDIVLLDVMMPGMDGFEVCRQIKSTPGTTHVPVVMVTTLGAPEDRVTGLQAGADDFLTKPVNEVALMARVRSLVRLKHLTDEIRLRAETSAELGVDQGSMTISDGDALDGNILIAEEPGFSLDLLQKTLAPDHRLTVVTNGDQVAATAGDGGFDLAILSFDLPDTDGLALCGQLRSMARTRQMPILIMVEGFQEEMLIKGLDIGVNDYLMRPIEPNELSARVRTQIKRTRYAQRLRDSYQKSIALAITDPLTGLYNRRYLSSHLKKEIESAGKSEKPLSLAMMDVDFFKEVNDTHGHDVGDEVLTQVADRITKNLRGIDLACRFGGEEFVIVMPDTEGAFAYQVVDRLRRQMADDPFVVSTDEGVLHLTASFGVTQLGGGGDNGDDMLKRADTALYEAKDNGRNRVVPLLA